MAWVRLELPDALGKGDPTAEAALMALAGSAADGRSPWARIQARAADDSACARLVKEVTHRPPWVDPARLERGRRLFLRHAVDVTNVFTLGSLVETYLVPGIADVLDQTGQLVHEVQRRLAGTGQFVLDVVSPGAFDPGGDARGIAAAMRVRLMHARVRMAIAARRRSKAPVAINLAETLFTGTVHSVSIIRGLERLGVDFDPREAEDYQHLWRYVGYLLGIPEALLPASVEAEARMHDHLARHLFAPNDASRRLTAALLDAGAGQPPLFLPRAALAQFTRFFIGAEMADALELGAGGLSQRALMGLATARRRVGRLRLMPSLSLTRKGRAPAQRGALAPELGFRYYGWMVRHSARQSGRKLPTVDAGERAPAAIR